MNVFAESHGTTLAVEHCARAPSQTATATNGLLDTRARHTAIVPNRPENEKTVRAHEPKLGDLHRKSVWGFWPTN